RSPEVCDGAERVQELGAEGLRALQLDIRLAGVARELGGEAKDPAPQPLGLSPAPAPGKSGGADHVQELVGERSHGPQQAVAAQVVDGGLANTPSPNWSGHLGEVMLNLFEEEEN